MPEFVIEFISSIIPYGGTIITVFCFVVGQMIKTTLCEKIPNTYIPLITAVLGGLLVLVLPTAFSDQTIGARIIYGILCGWAATGAYESIKNLLSKNE